MGYDVVMAKAFVNPYRVGRPHIVNNLSRMGIIRVILTNPTKIGNNIKTLTDSVMVVGGMSMLYERPAVKALVIVSSDKDFLPLTEKARERGREVIFASFSNSMVTMIKERFQVNDLLEFSILNETFDSHIYSDVEEITV